MGFGIKTHDQPVSIQMTSNHPVFQYLSVLFEYVFKACIFHGLSA